MNTENKTLMELLAHAKHDHALNAEVLRMILNTELEESRPTLLKTYLEELKKIESDKTMELPPWMDDSEEGWKLRCKYGPKMDCELSRLVSKNLPEEEFYRRLWLYISIYVNLEGFDVGVVALFRCTTLGLLPYIYLDPEKMVRMAQDEFSDIMDALYPTAVHEMRCIMYSRLEQKTERASLLLNLLDRYEGKERVVLMAAILSEGDKSAMKVAALLDKLADID